MLQKITYGAKQHLSQKSVPVYVHVCVCTRSSVVEEGRDTLVFTDRLRSSRGFLAAQMVKSLPAVQETWI